MPGYFSECAMLPHQEILQVRGLSIVMQGPGAKQDGIPVGLLDHPENESDGGVGNATWSGS